MVLLFFQSGCLCFPSLLIALASTFSTVLHRSCESGQPCFIPDLKGDSILSFTIKYGISCEFFVGNFYQVEGVLFLVHWQFLLWNGLSHFSVSFEMIERVLSFLLLMWCIVHPLICQCYTTLAFLGYMLLVMVYNPFYVTRFSY